jgi:hypothetical protein
MSRPYPRAYLHKFIRSQVYPRMEAYQRRGDCLHLVRGKEDFYAKHIARYGYYDLFLIQPARRFIRSNTKKITARTCLTGEYAKSGLGKLVKKGAGYQTLRVCRFRAIRTDASRQRSSDMTSGKPIPRRATQKAQEQSIGAEQDEEFEKY